ncbi:hydrogenase expression protein HupH [Roseomonas terrae]|uniref:Hydrogenase expression protein HupH n=1 Tax=Neoroseomonas terrae TaxID=424799 RepID=A0ABS5EKU5_9PROT|nr:aspartate/glutamate racemase family protein [Neoroseomonas terrae]MBR0651637.1 hydrogenase expression protein HupH [Neoroseomonas terrae]
MRLLLVNPNTNARTTALMVEIARRAAPAGVGIEGATARHGAPLITDPAALATAAEAVRDLLQASDLAPFAGIIVAAFGDPGLDAARAAAPSTGIAEAAMAEAAHHGRFAVVTTTPLLADAIAERAAAYGHGGAFAGTWLTEGDAATLTADPARLEAALEVAARRALAEAGPDAVIIGGGPLAAAAAALRPRLPVPVIEPVPAAVALAVRRAHESG